MPTKELTYAEGSSNKFWKIKLSGASHTVEYGRVGTNGQSKTKEFDSNEAARKSFDKLIEQKIKKGYSESGKKSKAAKVTKSKVTGKAASKKVVKRKTAATKKTVAKKTTPKKKDDPTKITLVFDDAKSSKFWNISLKGTSHTVNYGKQGTAGQTKTKDFASKELALKSFDKLVTDKRKKGYVDAKVEAASKPTSKNKTGVKPSAAKVSVPEFDLSVTNDPGLTDLELRRCSFHSLPQLKAKASEPRTLEQAMDDFLTKVKLESYGWILNFANTPLDFSMSKPVAHFWLVVMARTKRIEGKTGLKKFLESIKKKNKFDGKISKAAANKLIYKDEARIPPEAIIPLSCLFSPLECLELTISPPKNSNRRYRGSGWLATLAAGFRDHLVPRLSEAEKKKLRARVKKTFKPNVAPSTHYDEFPPEHYAAAALGMHKEIANLVSGWEDGRYTGKENYRSHYERPQLLLSGLGSSEQYESEWRRLQVPLNDADDVASFISGIALSALDVVSESICSQTNKDEAASLMKVFARVRAPEAAEPILNCRLNSKAAGVARDWMNFNVGNCVAGLIETAANRGKLGDAAIEYYREVKRNGHEALIKKFVKKAGKKSIGATRIQKEVIDFKEKVFKPFDAKSTPKWLKGALAKVDLKKTPKLPAWASVENLAPLTIGEKKFNDEQLETVLQVLATTPVDEKAPLLEAIKESVDGPTRDKFAWQLFELWLEDGANSKQKWTMGTIGHIGDDGCVLKLTPMVRAWPGESQHQRAVFGLQCLRGVGTSTALMQLSGIAQKLKFKGLKTKAALFVDEIAKEKGMTRDELEDRVIPDCGLDEMGRREISFGSRKFDFVLGGDLKPMVRDENGKVRPNPPKPGAKDDAKIAEASLAQWKLAKKQIKDVAVLQSGRLEQGMVRGRRWPVADFETLLVRHPLMTHLVQKVIWGSFAKNGKRQSMFRVTEERDYADVSDKAVSLAKASSIGLVHPLEMNEKEKAAWGEVFGDYEIISPFPQLGRPIYEIEPAEKKDKELKRFHGLSLYAPTMVFTLEKMGWTRGEAMDGGCFDEHSKQFPAYDVTAVVGYDGSVAMGWIDPDELLKTDCIHFCKGMRPPSGYRWDKSKKLKLGDVPKLVASEVLAELNVLKSKAK